MADPGPVAQTFLVDQKIQAFARLDGIVALIDAKHVEQHLDEPKPEGVVNEAAAQVAFADRLLLNKTDLVNEADLERVEARLRGINHCAPIQRCMHADVSVDRVLNINGFDLKRALKASPGKNNAICYRCPVPPTFRASVHMSCGASRPRDSRIRVWLVLGSRTADLLNANAAPTKHDKTVSSVSLDQGAPRHLRLVAKGDLDLTLLQDWFSELLHTSGNDLFRMKGILAVAHANVKFVYHGVHMLFNGAFEEAWGEDELRDSKLVFIGKNLDAKALAARFDACLATPENLKKKADALRFAVGDRVECKTGSDSWSPGSVVALLYRDHSPNARMPPGMLAPYQISLDVAQGAPEHLIWAPVDDDRCIRVLCEGPQSPEDDISEQLDGGGVLAHDATAHSHDHLTPALRVGSGSSV